MAYASKIPCHFAGHTAPWLGQTGDIPCGKTKNRKRYEDLSEPQEPYPSKASWRGLIRRVNTVSRIHLGKGKL